MEQNLLKKDEIAPSQAIAEERKKKKRKILKQEEIDSMNIEQYNKNNENVV